MTLFSHSLHDRQPVPVDANEADHRRMLWTRAVGRRDHGSRMAEGRVSIDSDSYVMQIGGDLLHAQAGHDGAVRVGLMAGYGEARADSVSTLIRPDGTVRARARGRTSGYAGGLYGTYHAEEASRLGAYADAWIQFGRYDNRVGSDLGTARYASRVWSASLEGGYAVKPFAPDSALANLVIEPHAQIIHARYRANDATLQDTRMRSGRNRATLLRGGVRLYPGSRPTRIAARSAPLSRPTGCAATRRRPSGWTTTHWPPPRHATRSNSSWAWTPATRRTQVSAQLIGQFGGGERGYGGMLNLSHAW